nr:hypothetical protein BN444_01991 [Xanthomonas translucens pv. translucens DSM 18974]
MLQDMPPLRIQEWFRFVFGATLRSVARIRCRLMRACRYLSHVCRPWCATGGVFAGRADAIGYGRWQRAQAGPDWRRYGSPASQSSSEPSLMSANSGVEK